MLRGNNSVLKREASSQIDIMERTCASIVDAGVLITARFDSFLF